MNALWIDENTDPDYPRLLGRGFTHLYFAYRDSRLSAWYLDTVRAHGFTVGIYWASTWDAALGGKAQAELVNRAWLRLGGKDRLLCVQANIEEHDPERIVAFLTRWRELRPFAQTSLALEGFQGGWLRQILWPIIDAKVTLVPEAYDGGMRPFDTAGVIRDLTDVGFPAERVVPFHDAARLYRGWYGFAFTQARLP